MSYFTHSFFFSLFFNDFNLRSNFFAKQNELVFLRNWLISKTNHMNDLELPTFLFKRKNLYEGFVISFFNTIEFKKNALQWSYLTSNLTGF